MTLATFGPQDFPWSNASLILELYHGRTQPWQQLVFRSLMVRRARIRLIGPLIDTSLGVTPERGYLLWNDPATRYVGRGFAMYMKTAKIWPSPDVGDDFRTPVLCDIPVVFAHGDWDLKTPIENAYEIAPFFPNSRLIVAHRGGHGVLEPIHREHPDVWSELVEFLRTGDLINIPARVTLRASRRFSPPTFELSDENDKPSDSDADGK